MKPSLRAATFVLAATLAGGASAQIYQWTDERGQRQVSQFPPTGAVKDLKVVRGGVATPVSPAPGGEAKKPLTYQDKALEFNKRQIAREEAEKREAQEAAEAAERKQRCVQAQGYLKNLQIGGRVVKFDPKTGERAFLDDKEREKEIVSAQRAVDELCKPLPAPAAAAAPKK